MRSLCLSLGLGCLLLFPPLAEAQTSAWGEAGGELWSIGLPNGQMESVGTTGLASDQFVAAMERAPGGRVLGLVVRPGTSAIFEFDTSTGQATPFLTLDLDESMFGLTVLDDGRTFVLHDSSIYEVDTASGTTSFLVDIGPFGTLADDGSNLLAVLPGVDEQQIYSVDPDTGVANLVRAAADLNPSRVAATVGPGGKLWLLRRSCSLSGCNFAYQEIEDFGSGDSTLTECCGYFLPDPRVGLASLAWNGLSPAVAIPSLGPIGQLLLLLLIVTAGWFLLIKR